MLSRVFLVAIVLVPLFDAITEQDASAQQRADSANTRDERLASMKKSLDDVELIVRLDGSDAKPTRVEQPIQRWSNPIVQIADATVFVWTHKGRPAVIAQVAELTNGDTWQEYQSLTTELVEGHHGDDRFWTPTSGGIEWLRVPMDQPPNETARGRLIQMRRVAEQLEVSDSFEFKKPSRLRLLSKPLYRYSAPDSGVVDGAIFSFALGTDPEVVMLIEARAGESSSWRMAFARMTGYACSVKMDGKQLWSRDKMPWPHPRDLTFIARQSVTEVK